MRMLLLNNSVDYSVGSLASTILPTRAAIIIWSHGELLRSGVPLEFQPINH